MVKVAPLLATTAFLLLTGNGVGAHEGALDENGCHYERAHNKYHCHRDMGPNPDRNAPVKKSRENVCHDIKSPNYRMLKKFVAYRNMAACVTSGGSEPIHNESGGLSNKNPF